MNSKSKYKKSNFQNKKCWLFKIVRYPFKSNWKEVIKIYSKKEKICELYFKKRFNCVCIAKELGISSVYVTKVLKGHPNYEKEKEKRSRLKHKKYLERRKTNRKLKTQILKGREDYELECLRHLQWQHVVEMSKRYLV